MKFKVKGRLRMKEPKPFSWATEAPTENMAREKTYSFFGNTYRLPRNKVIIESVESTEQTKK